MLLTKRTLWGQRRSLITAKYSSCVLDLNLGLGIRILNGLRRGLENDMDFWKTVRHLP